MATVNLATFPDPPVDDIPATDGHDQKAVLAGGCFWCVEGVYRQLAGVRQALSGYSGDSLATAQYKTVCSGQTNHAEAVEITFDPTVLSYGQLLKVFFSVVHDPTQLNRQGADVGRQYRSAIFTADEHQHRVATAYIAALNDAEVFAGPVVTEVVPLEAFYVAEDDHQNYAERYPWQPYVACTALPKMAAVRQGFPHLLRRRP